MKQIDIIKNMTVEQLARFLIIETTEEEVEVDWNEESYLRIHSAYATPFGAYPHWWSFEDVMEETVQILQTEVDEFCEGT